MSEQEVYWLDNLPRRVMVQLLRPYKWSDGSSALPAWECVVLHDNGKYYKTGAPMIISLSSLREVV